MNTQIKRMTGTAAALVLLLTAGPGLAVTAARQDKPTQTDAAAARDAELRARGETYRRAGDEQQTPEELAATRNLNAEQAAAARQQAERLAQAQADYAAQQEQHRQQVAEIERANADAQAKYEAEQAEYERQQRASALAQAEYERAMAAYRAACQAPNTRCE